ncbi:MAG: NYN domain-containing protein [Phycisphaerales bacterium]|nr:NYN domain-containing protein [Phycisphaerales bacterium]
MAVFVDLDGLAEHDRTTTGASGGGAGTRPALAYGRLLATLTGRRHLIRAFAYGDGSVAATLDGNGFEHRAVADRLARVVALTVDAMQVAARVDTMVFLGGDEALAPLYGVLAAQGIRIESAGFGADRVDVPSIPASHHHELGEECTFSP